MAWKVFSCVYSSHVIEHQVDLVTHFQSVEKLLKVGGIYVLAVPDKRYCFDYFNPLSELTEVLTAYKEKRKLHTFNTWLIGLQPAHNDPARHWHDDHGEQKTLTREMYDEATVRYETAKDEGQYVDMHAWRFTPESMREILMTLYKEEFIHFKIREVYPTEQNTCTFFVVLEKI